jgi:hypothetical protein
VTWWPTRKPGSDPARRLSKGRVRRRDRWVGAILERDDIYVERLGRAHDPNCPRSVTHFEWPRWIGRALSTPVRPSCAAWLASPVSAAVAACSGDSVAGVAGFRCVGGVFGRRPAGAGPLLPVSAAEEPPMAACSGRQRRWRCPFRRRAAGGQLPGQRLGVTARLRWLFPSLWWLSLSGRLVAPRLLGSARSWSVMTLYVESLGRAHDPNFPRSVSHLEPARRRRRGGSEPAVVSCYADGFDAVARAGLGDRG